MDNEKIFGDENAPVKTAAVGIIPSAASSEECEISLDELECLIWTAGGECVLRLTQTKQSPDPKTYIGSGKLLELSELCRNNGVGLVVFDTELSPSQIRNIEDALTDESDGEEGRDIRVIDRSMLILDIFALHASSGEGKLQVELAQLRYTIPRLTGKGTELSRLGGGIGTRGPGESKLESDRRHLHRRIAALESELEELKKTRENNRRARERSGIYRIAIAGYTNAGKSTLLNYLTGAGILAEDKLFATLDPTTRRYTLPCGSDILLTDTVGFIRNLPHHLINAFHSTLSEVAHADALLVIIDASDPNNATQLGVTEGLLQALGASEKPVVYVYNKCDLPTADMPYIPGRSSFDNMICISAKTGEGIPRLTEKLTELALNGKSELFLEIPNSKSALLNTLYNEATVVSVEYGDEFITVRAVCDARIKGIMREYIRADKS